MPLRSSRVIPLVQRRVSLWDRKPFRPRWVCPLTPSIALGYAPTSPGRCWTRCQAAARQALPSIITVQVLGFGNEATDGVKAMPPSPVSGDNRDASNYDPAKLVQVVGFGSGVDPQQWARLTADERRRLQQNRQVDTSRP
jgi:hypothetical protein